VDKEEVETFRKKKINLAIGVAAGYAAGWW
jgi:hypothetical protein